MAWWDHLKDTARPRGRPESPLVRLPLRDLWPGELSSSMPTHWQTCEAQLHPITCDEKFCKQTADRVWFRISPLWFGLRYISRHWSWEKGRVISSHRTWSYSVTDKILVSLHDSSPAHSRSHQGSVVGKTFPVAVINHPRSISNKTTNRKYCYSGPWNSNTEFYRWIRADRTDWDGYDSTHATKCNANATGVGKCFRVHLKFLFKHKSWRLLVGRLATEQCQLERVYASRPCVSLIPIG